MSDADLAYRSLTDVAVAIRAGELSPVTVTEAMLDRIARLDGKLCSYATVTVELARAQARQAEAEIRQGRYRGVLHGVPVAVKDLCFTWGIRTICGSPIFADWEPEYDATVVERLRTAGAVLLGKLHMTEGAYADHHPLLPRPRNPWHEDCWVGASSSGSAVATAAGLCFGSLGSDTGGSIRFPSAANGLTGLKPTWGRVSRHGVFPAAESLDHVGPMARSAADAAALLGAIAGPDPNDPTTLTDPVPDYPAGLAQGVYGARGLTIGMDPLLNSEGVEPLVTELTAAAAEVLAGLGAELREVRVPDPSIVVRGWTPMCAVETALAHQATFPAQAEAYGPTLRRLIETGHAVDARTLAAIGIERERFRGRLARLFREVDLLLIPAMYLAAPSVERMSRLEAPNEVELLLRFTAPFDMTGSPTITLPCGFTPGGLPVGFQLVGRHLAEGVLLRAGHAYQQATDWHTCHPAL